MTIGELLNYGFDHLSQAGIPDAVLEAELLLEYAMGKDRVYLHLNRNQNVSEAVQEKYRSYITDRCRHRPLQHIVGQTEFYGLKLKSDNRALIPRPETEILVEEVLEHWQLGFRTILDIGTGSGAIAIALAKHLPLAKITATDQSSDALELAGENIKAHGLDGRISLMRADLFPSEGHRFDCIVSNPPYIPTGEISRLQPEVSRFEPVSALDGGSEGLEFYKSIADRISDHISKPGLIALESGMGQAEQVADMMSRVLPVSKTIIKKDLAGIKRVVLVKMH